MKKSAFIQMEEHAAFARVASFTITHPKKPNGYAVVNVAYPAPGHGERPLTVFIVDAFGESRTCTMGRANGYGYDKLTAALSGLSIDGIELTDHCGTDKTAARLLKRARAGTPTAELLKGKGRAYNFANWDETGPTSCYRKPGLDVLRAWVSRHSGDLIMPDYTPGPWIVEDGSTVYGSRSMRRDKFEVCDCKGYKTEREANARLIAAAPDMRAALLECEAILQAHDYPIILRQVRAALAKGA